MKVYPPLNAGNGNMIHLKKFTVCILPVVYSLHSTLGPHFSLICSQQFAFSNDQIPKRYSHFLTRGMLLQDIHHLQLLLHYPVSSVSSSSSSEPLSGVLFVFLTSDCCGVNCAPPGRRSWPYKIRCFTFLPLRLGDEPDWQKICPLTYSTNSFTSNQFYYYNNSTTI